MPEEDTKSTTCGVIGDESFFTQLSQVQKLEFKIDQRHIYMQRNNPDLMCGSQNTIKLSKPSDLFLSDDRQMRFDKYVYDCTFLHV